MSIKLLPLINRGIIDEQLINYSIPGYKGKIDILNGWKDNQNLRNMSETELKYLFFPDFFIKILGYTTATINMTKWTLNIEKKTETDSSKPDGILGFYTNISSKQTTQVVIEFKDMNTNLDQKQKRSGKDYGTPVEQAFSYASKYDGCKWIIVSNFEEMRLYKLGRSQNYCERFFINDLTNEDEFKKFYILLNADNLINENKKSLVEELSEKAQVNEINISNYFYFEYKHIRLELIDQIRKNNSLNTDELVRCAQKLLDRIIFICFCEYMGLLDRGLLRNHLDRGKTSLDGVYCELKRLFTALDKGKENTNINKFNGELFKPDRVLDNIDINDEFFLSLEKITKYNFSTELNVNILGHIFEQSISDLEEIKVLLSGGQIQLSESKRKRDGIFYTPEKITKFIVENTIGNYLQEKYIEAEAEYELLIKKELDKVSTKKWSHKPPTNKKISKSELKELKILEIYRDKLKKVKVLDPACGSGAFLVQVFDYLFNEYRRVETVISNLSPQSTGQLSIFDLNKQILNNNIYGVDINEESVEITKLALWLKTAEKEKPLTALDNNIKCGNSIISERIYDTQRAFSWETEFHDIISQGGFDIIVGNPPYIDWFRISPRGPFESGNFLGVEYEVRINHKDSQPNIYIFFLILACKMLKFNGQFGFITSQEWLNVDKLNNVKDYLMRAGSINNLIFDSKYSVFVEPNGKVIGTNSSISFFKKGKDLGSTSINIPFGEEERLFLSNSVTSNEYKIQPRDKWNFKGIDIDSSNIIDKINNQPSVSISNVDYFEVFGGFQPQVNRIPEFTLSNLEYSAIPDNERAIIYKAVIEANFITRYNLLETDTYWIVANNIESEMRLKEEYPVIYEILSDRIINKDEDDWYKFPNIRNIKRFNQYDKKLLSPRCKNFNSFALDAEKHVFKGTNTAIGVKKDFDINYILGVLNSSTLTYWYHIKGKDYHGNTRKFEPSNVMILSIPIASNEIQTNIAKLALLLTKLNKILKEKSFEFTDWLHKRFCIQNETKGLFDFYSINFDTYYEKVISKSTKVISPKELKQLRENYILYSAEMREIENEKVNINRRINEIVYSIYNINYNEALIIEEYIKGLH